MESPNFRPNLGLSAAQNRFKQAHIPLGGSAAALAANVGAISIAGQNWGTAWAMC